GTGYKLILIQKHNYESNNLTSAFVAIVATSSTFILLLQSTPLQSGWSTILHCDGTNWYRL
ncbi:hypothetical protein, partial [Chryseobacterium sp. CH1]|uniref:hypothetical protein n=1 Tax=Chryseobacterium sp. CH1 TaxID=713551 RepID=UPI001E46DE7E